MKKRTLAAVMAAVMLMSSAAMPVYADWQETSEGMMYIDESGEPATGITKIDGETYYFNKKGIMKTGWLTTKSGQKYYFTKDGTMKTGWMKTKKGKYYFGKNGIMYTGLHQINKKLYYFSDSGIMQTGWVTAEGSKYYFKDSGELAVSCTLTIDGTKYKFSSVGVPTPVNAAKPEKQEPAKEEKQEEKYMTSITEIPDMTLSVGTVRKITPKCHPAGITNDDLVYKSSKPSVATITLNKDGHSAELKTLKAGTTVITVSSAHDKNVKTTFTVTVKK
ncbi:MAG: N-acetylmuramoyl-L-alanine amidase family protein [Huintestinicola sp.]